MVREQSLSERYYDYSGEVPDALIFRFRDPKKIREVIRMTKVTITSRLTSAERQQLARAVRTIADKSGPEESCILPVPGTRVEYDYLPGDYGRDVHEAMRRLMTAVGRTFDYRVD